MDSLDKAQDALDLIDRRMQRRFVKIEAKEEQFNALLELEDFKDDSIRDRFNAVFSKKETIKKTSAEYGDVIGIDRGPYQHYGIYIGNDRVIHYIRCEEEFDIRNLKDIAVIREDDISGFLDGDNEYFVFDCESKDKHKLIFNPLAVTLGKISLEHIFQYLMAMNS